MRSVYPMYKTFIEPDLKTAHLRIFNSFNPFSGLLNATFILKSAHPVTDRQIKAVLKVCTFSPTSHTSRLLLQSELTVPQQEERPKRPSIEINGPVSWRS